MMLALPDYTKRTRRLTPEAAAVRDLFFAAKTPIQLVFTDLPAACGIKFTEGAELQSQAELFSKKLAAALTEIKVAYHALIGDFVEELRAAFGIDKKLGLYDLRETLRGRSQGLQALTIDQQGLKAFIGRLCDAYGDETQWIVSLATFLARKPPEKWTDEDVQAAGFRLREFVSRINDLRQLQLHYERGRDGGGKDFDAALLRLISTRKGESEALITLDQRTRQFVAKHVADLNASLDKLPSVEVKLATLVTVLEALLRPQVSDAETNTTPANKVA
jgi:hypothetical protein